MRDYRSEATNLKCSSRVAQKSQQSQRTSSERHRRPHSTSRNMSSSSATPRSTIGRKSYTAASPRCIAIARSRGRLPSRVARHVSHR